MGCAASTPGPVDRPDGQAQGGSHQSSPHPAPNAAPAVKMPPPTQYQVDASKANTLNGSGGEKPVPAPVKSNPRRRMSSEEFAQHAATENFTPVTKGKVSDATFGAAEERFAKRQVSQDDSGAMAQQLGLMQSHPFNRLDFDPADAAGGAARGGGGGAGTRGGGAASGVGDNSRRDRRSKMALARHTLDTAPGAQGVVRHTAWVSAGGGRRGHRNIIESQPEVIAGKKDQQPLQPPPEERRLDRLEAKFLKETLAKHWLFEKFSDKQFVLLTKNCETVDLAEGQPLIIQGQEDNGRMYILHRGTLSVHVKDAKKDKGTKENDVERASESVAGHDRDTEAPTPTPSGHAGPESSKVPADRGVHVATVLSGGWVGDMALLYRTTRTATVIAESDSRVLAVPRVAYETVIADEYIHAAQESSSQNEFSQVPVLATVKDSTALTQQARSATWSAGDMIMESGNGARELVVITQGEVEFQNARASAGNGGAGGEYRLSLQHNFLSPSTLKKGDVLAGGRAGDEAMLVTLHNSSIRTPTSSAGPQLKLTGGLPRGAARAVATTDGKGYRFYLQDIVTHPALLDSLTESLEGIRALLHCTPCLANRLTATFFDAASFVMKPVKYNAGATISVQSDKTGGNPLAVLVSGRVGVRRNDDVNIRDAEQPKRDESRKSSSDDGIVGRLYDCMTTIVAEGEPGMKLVAKSPVTLLTMSRADHSDMSTRHQGLAAVRMYPPKRPGDVLTAFGNAPPASDGNVLKLTDISFERKIGQGAYGAVYLVVHKPTGKTLAAKIIKLARLRKHQKDDAINVERHVMQDSDNPFIVRLYASYKTRTHLLLVMEAGLGGELFSFLLRQEHQVLREDSVRFYGACVLSGLHAMHDDGYMYRDLKPENVVITADGYCKIVDFGFAKRTAARTYTVCGTNAYLSPEMLTVQGHNFEVDYWAFGVFLYEMAIGCASFNVETDGTMNHEMPPFKVCQNILNPNYKLRFDIGVYKVSPELQDVITQLLERRVEHRIGCRVRGAQDIYEHPFFAPIDFDKLKRLQYQPPWNPELQSGLDTRYFESTHKMRKSELIAFGIDF